MHNRPFSPKGSPVPSGRLSRLARFGGLATGVAGGVIVDAARQFADGKRPSLNELLLTPANAMRVTRELAQLRGAAMKVGQLMSMDAGDLLPPEMTEILSRLRSDAQHMPARQLQGVLDKRWGKGWRGRFAVFNATPIAAASIGQVHRARTKDGRDLAVKIQYPGVRLSIDSDVNNVASLMRMSGVLPKSLDIAPMLAEAKRQLREEADYAREGAYLRRFGALLADAPDFLVPELHEDFTTPDVLTMSFAEGVAVEALADAPQEARDRVATLLIDLLLRELFEFRLMQTDPNFANYRYSRKTDRVILLDFGAAREIPETIAEQYRALMRASLAGDAAALRRAILDIGFFAETTQTRHQDAVMRMVEIAMAPMRRSGVYDFGDPTLTAELRDEGMAIAAERDFWHIPPMDTLFVQRKFAGMHLLATRLKARVDVRALLERHL